MIKKSEWEAKGRDYFGIWDGNNYSTIHRNKVQILLDNGSAEIRENRMQINKRNFNPTGWFNICTQLNVPANAKIITIQFDKLEVFVEE